MQILDALRPIKRSLCGGVANALKQRPRRNRSLSAQQACKQAGLVKAALSLSRGVQGHRHDDVESISANSFVIQRSMKPARYKVTQMNLATVFKFVDDFANDSATAIRRYRRFEVNLAMSAIGTGERAGNGAFEWFGAFLAKGRNNAKGLRVALIAEILTGSNASAANGANWWVKKRYGRFQWLKPVKRDHISARFALLSTLLPLRPAAQFQQADFFPAMGRQLFADA